MNIKDWDEVLKFVEVFTRWPPVVLAVVFLLRNKLSGFKLKGKDLEVELKTRRELGELRRFVAEAAPELVKQVTPKLLDDILADNPGEEQAKAGSKSDAVSDTGAKKGKDVDEDSVDEDSVDEESDSEAPA